MRMGVVRCRRALFLLLVGVVALAHGSERSNAGEGGLVVDLDYARYEGFLDGDVRVWKGVRYAAAPVGPLRWQAPRAPADDSYTDAVTPAVEQPPLCPQTGASADTPAIYGFTSAIGDEDCLFLNVYALPDAERLPVFVWIHGGGYGLFGATDDPIPLMNTNDNGFVSVIIQYRLGAFGFLSSREVAENGVVNAGLLDQNFALQWVQKYIDRFGGDPRRVTMAGESAGAGAAMLQAMAYGGRQREKLFENIIAASPFSPPQYRFDDPIPTQKYEEFAELAGCGSAYPSGTASGVFDCLVAADSEALQRASFSVSEAGLFGTWAFLPVTDGDFVQQLPSDQLLSGRVNGKRILSGNNANEGVPLSPPTVTTEEGFVEYFRTAFPRFTDADISNLLQLYSYPQDDQPVDPNDPLFDTLGNAGPTAISQSIFGTGQQQRLFNAYAESTFVCPSYWLAEAFSRRGKESWKYQYSVTSAFHGADLTAYFSRDQTVPNEEFRTAFQRVWGSFIIDDTPVITVAEATAGDPEAVVPVAGDGYGNDECSRRGRSRGRGRGRGRGNGNAYGRYRQPEESVICWPTYEPDAEAPKMMNFNTSGGSLDTTEVTPDLSITVRIEPPDISNVFRLVDADAWEGGRGERCSFWSEVVGDRVPQ